MRIHEESEVRMSTKELVDVIAAAARYEWLKRANYEDFFDVTYENSDKWDAAIDAKMHPLGDGVPTMGEQAESELSEYRCQCGRPMEPGWMHSTTVACYKVGDASGS